MISLRSYCTISVVAAALGACGGPSRPGPLKHHLDDMYIARVPIDQKRTVLDAQQEWQLAKLAWQEAQQEYDASSTDVRVAENESKKASLEQSSIKEKQKAADKTGDLTQINETTLLMRAAKLSHKAAQKKVEYMKAQREWKRLFVEYSQDLMYAEEAKYEMAKARMAQQNNIQPRGFNPVDFQQQSEKRTRYAQRTKTKLDQKKARALRMKKEWKALEKEASMASASASQSSGRGSSGSGSGSGSSGSGSGSGSSGSGSDSGSSDSDSGSSDSGSSGSGSSGGSGTTTPDSSGSGTGGQP